MQRFAVGEAGDYICPWVSSAPSCSLENHFWHTKYITPCVKGFTFSSSVTQTLSGPSSPAGRMRRCPNVSLRLHSSTKAVPVLPIGMKSRFRGLFRTTLRLWKLWKSLFSFLFFILQCFTLKNLFPSFDVWAGKSSHLVSVMPPSVLVLICSDGAIPLSSALWSRIAVYLCPSWVCSAPHSLMIGLLLSTTAWLCELIDNSTQISLSCDGLCTGYTVRDWNSNISIQAHRYFYRIFDEREYRTIESVWLENKIHQI